MTEQEVLDARLTYYCQPIRDTQMHGWGKAELLVRAWGPDRTPYPTEEFIHAAEECGRIARIDLQALKHACWMLPSYLKKGITQLGVNVSLLSLRQEEFQTEAVAVLQQYSEICRYLVIEITESAPGEKEEWMRPALERLSRCGVDIAVDDFGKDHAGIFRILNMPFQYIKLDRAIVSQCYRDPFARLVTQKIVEAMHLGGKEIVAEGVETAAQAQELEQMGVRYLQGYYWSPPVPEITFLGHLASSVQPGGEKRSAAGGQEAKPPGQRHPMRRKVGAKQKPRRLCGAWNNASENSKERGVLLWEKH